MATFGIFLQMIILLRNLEVPLPRKFLGGPGILLQNEAIMRRHRTSLFAVELQAITIWSMLSDAARADGAGMADFGDLGTMYRMGRRVIWRFVT